MKNFIKFSMHIVKKWGIIALKSLSGIFLSISAGIFIAFLSFRNFSHHKFIQTQKLFARYPVFFEEDVYGSYPVIYDKKYFSFNHKLVEKYALYSTLSKKINMSFSLPFSFPVKRKFFISSDYGYRVIRGKLSFHKGLDIVVPYGTPVYAVEDGIVVFAGNSYSQYGKVVVILHKKKYVSIYAHLSKIPVNIKEGIFVKREEKIGYVGNTGYSTGTHLHFEVRKGITKTISPVFVF